MWSWENNGSFVPYSAELCCGIEAAFQKRKTACKYFEFLGPAGQTYVIDFINRVQRNARSGVERATLRVDSSSVAPGDEAAGVQAGAFNTAVTHPPSVRQESLDRV